MRTKKLSQFDRASKATTLQCIIALFFGGLSLYAPCTVSAAAVNGEGTISVLLKREVELSTQIEAVLAALASGQGAAEQKRITFTVPPGHYNLKRPIVFTKQNTEHWAHIEVNGRSGVVLDGGERLRNKLTLPQDLVHRVPPVCDGRISAYEINDADIKRFAASAADNPFSRSTENGFTVASGETAISLSRYPEHDYLAAKAIISNRGGIEIKIENGLSTNLIDDRMMWNIGGYIFHDYIYESHSVSHTPPTTLIVSDIQTKVAPLDNVRIAVFNSLSGLAPGKYIVDEASRALVICDRGSAGPVELARLTSVIRFDHAKNVTIRNMSIVNVLNDAVQAHASKNISISQIRISNTGRYGIAIDEGITNTIDSSTIEDTGGAGVILAGGDRRNLLAGSNSVTRSIVRRFGTRSPSYNPAVLISGVSNSVERTLVEDGMHDAIMLAGNNNLIRGNIIRRVNQDGGDAGSIYGGRDWTQRGNIIDHNLFYEIGPVGNLKTVAIYLDDFMSGTAVSNNVFCDVATGVLLGGGRDNQIVNNTFIGVRGHSIMVDDRGVGFAANMVVNENSSLRRSLSAIDINSKAYSSSYPHLRTIMSDDPQLPKYNVIKGNVGAISADDIVPADFPQLNRFEPTRLVKTSEVGPYISMCPKQSWYGGSFPF